MTKRRGRPRRMKQFLAFGALDRDALEMLDSAGGDLGADVRALEMDTVSSTYARRRQE